jgi:hypothetical protein
MLELLLAVALTLGAGASAGKSAIDPPSNDGGGKTATTAIDPPDNQGGGRAIDPPDHQGGGG